MTRERRHTMKKLLLPILCALMLCGCADTPPEETTASTETTTPAETTAAETTAMETTTAETTTETTTEAPIATETTYIESLGETKVKLSTMSEEDVKRILIEGGADSPDSYEISYIRYLVRRYEDDPNFVNGVSYSVVAKRLESIQNAVRAYYGMGPFDFEEWYHSFEETTEPLS